MNAHRKLTSLKAPPAISIGDEFFEDVDEFIKEREFARNEGESDEDLKARAQEAMEEANNEKRNEIADEAEIDLDIE